MKNPNLMNITVVIKCRICKKDIHLHGKRQIKQRGNYGFLCDECLANVFDNEMAEITQDFKSIN